MIKSDVEIHTITQAYLKDLSIPRDSRLRNEYQQKLMNIDLYKFPLPLSLKPPSLFSYFPLPRSVLL